MWSPPSPLAVVTLHPRPSDALSSLSSSSPLPCLLVAPPPPPCLPDTMSTGCIWPHRPRPCRPLAPATLGRADPDVTRPHLAMPLPAVPPQVTSPS
ncbi:hypothetical protein GUJ93_ZPchr0004g38940 [Zizania palustris]|uniref:Uncharacterized protein n=1 Tax=Zizania palustris TaxID=103762 RepID=A0A8J5S6D0_ZIZPA|nr:hypothetical protein GUJ93_ZPchr0004g38940 [Zizania palustris]